MTSAADVTFERLTALGPHDVTQIIALEEASFSNPWTPEAFADMLASPVTQLHVARAATGEVIAFCACWLIGDELHINTLAVKRPLRRQGIGTRLLRHVFEVTAAPRATLEVRRSNLAALKLYEGLGFTATAVRTRYDSHPEEDALILWRNP